jgi:hypothetical protein
MNTLFFLWVQQQIFFYRFGFFSCSFALALTSLSFATFPSLLIDAPPNFGPLLVSVSLGSTILALLLIFGSATPPCLKVPLC